MEATDKNQQREEIFAKVVRAGKRTYFFDVKETRAKEKYLTITESKRRFNNDTQKFFYEKHKLFLYKEDFDKFKGNRAKIKTYQPLNGRKNFTGVILGITGDELNFQIDEKIITIAVRDISKARLTE